MYGLSLLPLLCITIFLWFTLLVTYLFQTNTTLLIKKWYKQDYIAFLKRSHLLRTIAVAILLPLLGVISGWLVFLATGPIQSSAQITYSVLLLFILVIPFKMADEILNQKYLKKLALETGEEIVIDLNYRALHKIYKPVWELVLFITTLLYGITILRIEHWLIYLHLVIPWLMYFTLKGVKYQPRPYFKDSYSWMFGLNIFNFVMVIVYINGYLGEQNSILSSIDLVLGSILTILLIGRTVIYLLNYPIFRAEINKEPKKTRFSFLNAFIFTAGLLTITGLVFGYSLQKGDLNSDIGEVKEKYVLIVSEGRRDTVAVINHSGISVNDPVHEGYFQNDRFLLDVESDDEGYQLEALIELCRPKIESVYLIDNSDLFNNLSLNELIKFESKSGSITSIY